MKQELQISRTGKALPITYHPGVLEAFEFFATSCRVSRLALHRMTVLGTMNRHHAAVPEKPASPDIFRLTLGGPAAAAVYYTRPDSESVYVLGYDWENRGQSVDERDRGFFFVG